MATSFDIVEDRALMLVDDYKLTKLYNKSEDNFKKWCDGFLINAIPNFIRCNKYRNRYSCKFLGYRMVFKGSSR